MIKKASGKLQLLYERKNSFCSMVSNMKNDVFEVEYQMIGYDELHAMPHHDNSIEIIQTWSSGGYFIVKNNIIPIAPGSVFIINGMETHYSNPIDINKYNRSKIIISSDLFMKICSLANIEDFTNRIIFNDSGGCFLPFVYSLNPIDNLFRKANDAFKNNKEFSMAEIVSSVLEILLCIYKHLQERDASIDKTNSSDTSKTMHSITNYINMHTTSWNDFSLKNMASELNISQSYASHLFKKITNKSITEHITELRISDAKKLLTNTDMKVCEISEKLKFNDSNTFCKVFKKHVGCSPKTYRLKEGNIGF